MEDKQDKQKVTLYISPELHRQLKVQAAVEVETMSAIAERAVSFYLANPELVEPELVEDGVGQGQTHRIYSCPACATPSVLKDGEMVCLSDRHSNGGSNILTDESGELLVGASRSVPNVSPLHTDNGERPQGSEQEGSEQLVPC